MKAIKPNYDSEAVQASLVEAVCSYFGRVFDDHEQVKHLKLRGHRPGDEVWNDIMKGYPTLNETAAYFDITPGKVRKLLITGACYDTSLYRTVSRLKAEGKSGEEIGEALNLKPGTVRTYFPYERVIYNLEERSVNADRLQRFKKRHGGYKAKSASIISPADIETEKYYPSSM